MPLVDPVQLIEHLHSRHSLHIISDADYTSRLGQCKSAFQAAMCFVVYGDNSADRVEECRTVFHSIYQRDLGKNTVELDQMLHLGGVFYPKIDFVPFP
jgi:hypothetical protein